jgi:hypothetical protein
MDTEVQDGTGAALLAHWKRMADTHQVNENTAGALRAASVKVLGAIEDGQIVDVRKLDVEDALRRFENKHHKDMTPQSLATYKTRFRNAVKMYTDYLANPSGWKPPASKARTARGGRQEAPATNEQGEAENGAAPPAGATLLPPTAGLISYPYPLRTGLLVTLMLPADLTKREATRLNGFIESLAIEETPALMPGRPELNSGPDD